MKSYISPILIIVLVIALCLAAVAQPPNKMSYQSVIRDAQNSLVVNQQVQIRISIIQNNPNGSFVFMETHTANTKSNGVATT